MKRRHINWEEIRDKYVYGIEKDGKLEFPTISDLSKEYGIDKGTIGRHSSKEDWAKLRQQYINERSTKSQQKIIESISDKIAGFDTSIFNGIDRLAQKIIERIDALAPEKARTFDFVNLANALKQVKEIENSILGKEGTLGGESTKVYIIPKEAIPDDW